jgi:peptidoglycan/LPS O-acetylase OafA/YrhL
MNREGGNCMIKPLTSFRFLAALLVFFYHVGIWKTYQTGSIGVSFFFTLSGFILAINYGDRLRALDTFQIKKFYSARFAKIYPTHFLTFILSIPVYFLIPLKHSSFTYIIQAFINIFLVQSYIPVGYFSYNGPSWSISDEFFFYAVFPFLIYRVIRVLGGIRIKLFAISFIWVSMSVTSVIFSLIQNGPINTWLFYVFPLTRIFDFFVGLVLGLIFVEVKGLYLKTPKVIFTILEIFSIMTLVFIVLFSPNIPQNLRYGLIFTPFLSFIIFIFAFQKGVISEFLSKKPFLFLGEISFSFYMIHNLVLTYSFWSLLKLNITPITITCCFLLSVLFSSFLYYFYEEPLRKKIRNKLDKPNTWISKIMKAGIG